MSTSIYRLLCALCLYLCSASNLIQAWETGVEYLYDYDGQSVVNLRKLQHRQSAAVRFHAQLTVQSIDDITLALKLSEIRIKRFGDHDARNGSEDELWLPVETVDGEEEAVSDALHLLSPFVVVHNKGSFVNLMVESDEPAWSVNVKKAVASVLQLDVTGVRSGVDGGVFGERSSTLNSLEDGLTGDCLTTLRFTRLPYHRVIQHSSKDQVPADLCRSTNIYEIVKIKDFEDCRIDPLQTSATPPSVRLTHSANGKPSLQLKRSAAYKYVACGESSERATIVHIEGSALMVSPTPLGVANQQTVKLALKSRGHIHELLPSMARPKVFDTLVYFPPGDAPTDARFDFTGANVKEADEMIRVIRDVAQMLVESTKSDPDLSERLSTVSTIIRQLGADQLSLIWQGIINSTDSSARDLFLDCVAASGSQSASNFLLDLIELGQVRNIQAISLLVSIGHSIQAPSTGLLQRFVRLARSEASSSSRSLKMTALAVAAELLHWNCVVSQLTCRPDAQVVTEDFLPLVVNELENARSSTERLAVLAALGALGSEDVLLLLVPYIRGDDISSRIAAIRSLRRTMDSYPEKIIPLLSSLADNVAERVEVRLAAIDILLFHPNTPLKVWKTIAHRTWFEPIRQIHNYVHNVIVSLSSSSLATNTPAYSIKEKALQVVHLVRPSSGEAGFDFRSAFASGVRGFFSKIASWRVSDSLLPAFVDHEIYYQLGNAGFNFLQLSIWNYNMDALWSQMLDVGSSEYQGTRLTDIWDQISLRYRPEDDRVGLIHLKLLDSTLQGFFNVEDDLFDTLLTSTVPSRFNVRLIKFQQLVDYRTTVPTELGFPACFRFTLPVLISAQGNVTGHDSDVASIFSFKWTSEARILLPFSDNYVAAGVDLRGDLRGPRRVTLNESLVWNPPDKETDLAFFHVIPYTLTRSIRDDLVPTTEAEQLRIIHLKPPTTFALPFGSNLRFEVTSEIPSDCSVHGWLRRLTDADLSPFSIDQLERRVYRLRFLPDAHLNSISLSASIESFYSDEETVDFLSGSNDTMAMNSTNTTQSKHVSGNMHLKGQITAFYLNGLSSQWTPVDLEIAQRDDTGEANITVNTTSVIRLTQNWLNHYETEFPNISEINLLEVSKRSLNNHHNYQLSMNLKYDLLKVLNDMPYTRNSHFSKESVSCIITRDKITTYDGVEYNYKLNPCHHILTADCSRKAVRYAITGRNDTLQGMIIRITLENDVIDISEFGNISLNGAIVANNITLWRLRSNERVLARLIRLDNHTVSFRLFDLNLHVEITPSKISIHVDSFLFGRVCGLCGDADGEVAGEYKTADRCALSSGTLMASTFQISNGLDECPLLSDDAFQMLQRESYPCYSIDEQVPSILPLPPES